MLPLLAAVYALAAGPEFEALSLDGQTHSGAIVSLDERELVLEGASGRSTHALASLAAIVRKPALPAAKEAVVLVELIDGSLINGTEYTTQSGNATLRTAGGAELMIPTRAVRTVRFGMGEPRDPKLTRQWTEITETKASGDLLVIRKEGALDYFEGVLGDMTAENCQFELDGDAVPVKRPKIEGLVYFHAKARELAEPLGQLVTADGSRSQLLKIAFDGERLDVTTPGQVRLKVLLEDVSRFDFSSGKIAYLSDLDPEQAAFTPLVGLKEPPAGLAEFFAYRRDVGFEQSPLKLDGKIYKKGLALASRTELVYKLPGKFRQFRATVGIDDSVRETGNVRLEITGDGKRLWQGDIAGSQPAQELDLDISGVRRLKILADYGQNQDIGDRLDLAEARVSK